MDERRRNGRRLMMAGLIAVSCASLLGACGGSKSNGEASKSADTVLSDAKAASTAASSVHVVATGTSDGKPLNLNLVAGKAAGGGSVTTNGATLQLVSTGGKVYIKASEATWKTLTGSSSVAALVANKWIDTPAGSQDFSQLAQFVNITDLINQLKPSGALVKQPVTTFDGQKVVPLKDTGSNSGTLYIADTGTPYIVGIKGSSDIDTATFSDYGSAKAPAAPSGAISLPGLGG